MTSENKTISLKEEDTMNKYTKNKTTRTYDLNDNEIKIINLDGDIVIKLLENNRGVFVDFRKYYKGYPTKRGIRILASKFKEVAKLLDEDISDHLSLNK